MTLVPLDLRGEVVHLRSMSLDHVDGLVAAATEDRATFGFTEVPADHGSMTAHVAALLEFRANGSDLPFTTCDARTGRVLGATRFLWLRSYFGRDVPDAVEIGGTWLAASAQRTGANTDAKLLMLTHAFEVWGVARVDLKTDARNARSRTAIERLGARLDGVMRSWQPSYVPGEKGRPRDTALYSIIPSEWPAIRDRLRQRARAVRA
ncbi:MAG: GNAT family protein [Acidimicrobiia bacterium]